MDILFKPVPDDDRPHVMDPRVYQIAENKRKMFSQRAKGGFRLSNERYRPDKITYDLTQTPVDCEEKLIPINGDHMIDIYIYHPAAAAPGCPVLVYLHGGGFTAGDMRLFANQMKLIAEKSGAIVVFPEYRLAPECPFPGPVEDAWGTVRWVYEHAGELGADPQKLMVAGDSAGGSLTNACVLQDDGGIIKKIVVIYPSFDSSDYRTQTLYHWSYDAYEIIDEQREIAYSRVDRIRNNVRSNTDNGDLYLQNRTSVTDPLVSAVFASDDALRKFPETVIVAAEYDYLRVGSDYAAKKLKSLGVHVRSVRYCGCDHGFLDLLGTIAQSEDLCLLLAAELKAM